MVYRRRKSFRRRFKRRYGARKRPYKRMKKVIRRTVYSMAETKTYWYDLTTHNSIGTTWHMQALFPDISASFAGIIGKKYALVGIRLTGTLVGGQSNLGTDDQWNHVRIVACEMTGAARNIPVNMPTLTWGIKTPIRLKSPVMPSDGTTVYIKRKLFDKTYKIVSPGRDSLGYMQGTREVSIYKRFKRPLVLEYETNGQANPTSYVQVCFVSDSLAVPSPGFASGVLEFFWKDL